MIAEDDDRTDSVRNRGRRTYVLPDRRNGGLSVVSLVPWLDQNPLFSLSLSLSLSFSLSLSLSLFLLAAGGGEGGGREAATNVAAVAIVTEHSHDDEE